MPSRLVGSVLFPCPPASYTIDSFPGELIWVPHAPAPGPCGPADPGRVKEVSSPGRPPSGATVPCLLLPYESARFIVIFFHSNAEDLGRCRWFCHFLREQFQVHVLAVEYPGYGVCPGPPSREGVINNALAALHFVTQVLKLSLEQVKLFGRSIGTGPALHLAARFRVSGLVLVTPFVSVKQLFRDRVGLLSLLVEEWFQNDEAIAKVESPTMFIHGRKDAIVPWQHSEALYRSCSARRLFINPAHMEHNTNLTSDMSYLIIPMFRFFSLPDYCFERLEVPSWAFDKRRSPLYVRPCAEVCSHASVPPGAKQGGSGISVPAGDQAEVPVDQAAADGVRPRQDLRGRAAVSKGDQPIADLEKVTVLTHPTVLHVYKATKQRYDFQGGSRAARTASLPPARVFGEDEAASEGQGPSGVAEDSEEVEVGLGEWLRRTTLGDHMTASSPPRTSAPARMLSVLRQPGPIEKTPSGAFRPVPRPSGS